MAMSDYSLSDIAAVTDGVGGGNRGNGFGDGNGWWILLLFILLGWGGNRGFGGNGQGGGGMTYVAGGNELYPWLNQSNQINDGFRDQMLNSNIEGIQQGVNNLSTQLCNCCSDMQMSLANGFAGVEAGANARQMANMQQGFGLAQQVQSLGADIAREACADRAAVSDGVRDILANQTASVQRILDQLCQDKIDAKNDEIQNLRQQLNMQNLAASQIAQTAQILQGQNAEVDALYARLRDCPVPTQPVYGSQPIFTCQPNYNCGCNQGCGCNNGF